jgi:hypothetical protein
MGRDKADEEGGGVRGSRVERGGQKGTERWSGDKG